MTVGELRDRLAKIPAETRVVVHDEEGKENQFFGIDNVAVKKGNPSRRDDGKARFEFKSDGEAAWCFVEISPE